MHRRVLVFDVLIAAALFGVGAALRLGRLPAALVNHDSVGPYWKAATILWGGPLAPRPHAPESGAGLYWLFLPFVAGADGLDEAYARRFVFQALVAPAVYLAVRLATPRADVAASRLAGALVASWCVLSPGLRQTLESGYQGYLAVELGAAAAVCLAASVRQRAWSGLALPIVSLAMMCHPFAAAWLLPAVCVAGVCFVGGGAKVRVAATAGLVAALAIGGVRLRRLAEHAFDSGSFDSSALWAIPKSNDTGLGAVEVVVGSIVGVVDQDGASALLPLAGLVLVGLAALRVRDVRVPVVLAGLAVVSLSALGGAIAYLQPYHWRIVAPGLLVVAGIGLARTPRMPAWGAAVPIALLLGRCVLPWGAPVPEHGDLARTAAVARLVHPPAGGGWVEFGTVGSRLWGSPKGVRLHHRLIAAAGPPGDRPVSLVVAGSPEANDRVAAEVGDGTRVIGRLPGGPEDELLLIVADDPRSSERFTAAACRHGLRIERRAVDYLGVERPDLTEPFISMWWARCSGGNVGW